MTHTVWAQVTVYDGQPGESFPRVAGALDPEKAREALAQLLAFVPGYGPPELFNTKNPLYEAPRKLSDVIEDIYGRDPDEYAQMVKEERYAGVEERATDTRVKEWVSTHANPNHPALADPRTSYIAAARARIDRLVDGWLDETSLSAERAAHPAAWLGVDAQRLAHQTQGDDDAPFFSEAYLYTLVGKDVAGSVLSHIRRLSEALGARHLFDQPPSICPTCDRPNLP